MARPARPAGGNPFNQLLTDALEDAGCEVHEFTWHRALAGKYDVWLDHWPETLFGASSIGTTLLKSVLAVSALASGKLQGKPLVSVVHNPDPHEPVTRPIRWLLGLFDRFTTGEVHMNQTSAQHSSKPHIIIRHGHYKAIVSSVSQKVARHTDDYSTIVSFGLVRRYKGFVRLCAEFEDVPGQIRLHILGEPIDIELSEELRRRAQRDERICLDLRRVSDAELAAAVRNANLVVLPYLRLTNSGAAIFALSAGTPVFAKRSPATEELQEIVGESWIRLFDEFAGSDLLDALEWAKCTRGTPDLDPLNWSHAASAILQFAKEQLNS